MCNAETYRHLISIGICPSCMKKQLAPNRKKCAECLYRDNMKRKSKVLEYERSNRPKHGICYLCGVGELKRGFKICEKCYRARWSRIEKERNAYGP